MGAFWKAVGGALVVAGIGGAAGPVGRLAVFPGADTPIPPTEALGRLWAGAERVDFVSADGTELALAWFPAAEPRGSAVYFHATNQAAADAVWFARDLAARGVSVCVPEHRGYGGLAGEPDVASVLRDAEAALAACPSAPGRRVLVGRSLGAGVAARMAARGHGEALVLVSPFTSLDEMAGPFGWALDPRNRLDLVEAVRARRLPTTVVHGTDDGLVPFRMGRSVATAAGARFVPLRGAGHNEMFLGAAREALLDAVEQAAAEEEGWEPGDHAS